MMLASGLFVPQLVSRDPESGEFTSVEGPKGVATWEEAEEAVRFLKFASKSLRLDLRWASGMTLQTLRSRENAQSRYANR
jgi:hypothetical protein